MTSAESFPDETDLFLIQAALFVVILAVIYGALGRIGPELKDSPIRVVIAVSVSFLGVQGLDSESLAAVTVPYGALALSIPLLILLRLFLKGRGRKRRTGGQGGSDDHSPSDVHPKHGKKP